MANRSKWTQDEELKLIQDISTGININIIAVKHNRSESAVLLRLKKIIYENAIAGRSIQNISKLLNLNEEKTRQYFYSYKEFKEKHTELVDNNFQKLQNKEQTMNINNPKISQQYIQNNNNNVIEQPSQFGGEATRKIQKIQSKMHRIENENKILKLIVENKELTHKLNKMIKDGKIDKNIKKLIKVIGELNL